MKNKIVTCINSTHPIYKDNFKENKVKPGKVYKCIDELVLTAPSYYMSEYASLPGITIISHVNIWGWVKLCLPKECFRLANRYEITRFKMLLTINAPFRLVKIFFFKMVRKVDLVVRAKYYRKLYEE